MLVCNTCERTEEEVKISKNMICESCRGKLYYQRNKDSIKEYRMNNKEKIKYTCEKYRENNKKKISENTKEYYSKNKDKINEVNKEYYSKNKEKISDWSKEYYKNNKEKINEKNREYEKFKLNTDDFFRLKHNIKSMIRKSFNLKGYSKKSKTQEILRCSFEEFKLHLESKFEDWMTWQNKGLYNGELNYGWDIDHIIPLATAKTEDDIIRLNHYTNLQPLCSKLNRDIKKDNF